jgi:branched-subunit amino acid ABC-type transport system permease component
MSVTLQVALGGLSVGAVYGLVAVGHSVVYRLTGTIALAYGSLIGLGVFATLLFAVGTGPVSQTNVGTGRYLVALACGFAVCVAVGVGGYLVAVEPFLLRGSAIGWVAGSLAFAFALQALLESVFARGAYVFPDPIPFRRLGDAGHVSIAGASLQVRALFVLVVAVVVSAAAAWVLERTRVGRGLRAIADDVDGARLCGVAVDVYVPVAFGLAGGLAAIVAVVASPTAPVSPDTWALVGVKGLAAALAVRFLLPWASFVAGLGLGLLEATIAELHLGTLGSAVGWSEVLPLGLVLALVALRPPSEAREALD